ncbi:MAG: DUF655 domain-containing protein [Halococcoides sp.]
MNGAGDGDDEPLMAVVLDYLPHGRTEDDRPQYQKQPLAYLVTVDSFELIEAVLAEDADLSIGDRIALDDSALTRRSRIDHDDLPSGARSELEYAVDEIVDSEESRFVDFYNEAQPITTRLHSLNLLPGIGKKLRNAILDERKRQPFDSFEELSERVDGLHNPRQVIIDRIFEEIREDDLKYRIFAEVE